MMLSDIHTCKDCPDRYSGCHSKCEKYLSAKAEHDKKKEEITKKLKAEGNATSFSKDNIRRNIRRKGIKA